MDRAERAELLGVFDKDDDDHWGLIPRLDFSGLERQPSGLHTLPFETQRLSSTVDLDIINPHEELPGLRGLRSEAVA